MQNFLSNLSHLIMAVVVIAAAVVLASVGTITGAEAVTLIAAAGGFSLGAGAASGSGPGLAPTVSASTASSGESTVTITPATVAVSHQGAPTITEKAPPAVPLANADGTAPGPTQ